MASLQKAAAYYASIGLPIFPLAERTKFPLRGSHGWKDGAPDATPWTSRPRCNIGLAVAPCRLVLIDDDRRDGSPLPWTLPPTWTVNATRGAHRYFALPEGRAWAMSPVAGIDIVDRGYGLLPPSVHPSGREYVWDRALNPWRMPQPAMLPDSLTGIEDPHAELEYGPCTLDAADSLLGAAFAHLGMLGSPIGDDKIAVTCPWALGHSVDTGPSSTVIYAARAGGLKLGSFACRHGSCRGRKREDVLSWLPKQTLDAVRGQYGAELRYVERVR